VWISALASTTVVSNNQTSPVTGGTRVFTEPGPYSGYWMGAADGGAFAFGSAGFHGSAPGSVLGAPVVGIASTPDGGGYWLAASNGKVVGLGDAIVYGTLKGTKLSSPIVGIAATQDGAGYWLVGSDGGVFAFGDAAFEGSVPGVLKPGQHLGAPIIGIASTPAGDGYWLVGSDGGVFSFGSAGFFGSVPGALKRGTHLSEPIVGIAASPGVLDTSTFGFDSNGYWLVGADGGVFAFGLARYAGSVPGALKPGQHLAAPVEGVAGA
jgi:hypothetical protein